MIDLKIQVVENGLQVSIEGKQLISDDLDTNKVFVFKTLDEMLSWFKGYIPGAIDQEKETKQGRDSFMRSFES